MNLDSATYKPEIYLYQNNERDLNQSFSTRHYDCVHCNTRYFVVIVICMYLYIESNSVYNFFFFFFQKLLIFFPNWMAWKNFWFYVKYSYLFLFYIDDNDDQILTNAVIIFFALKLSVFDLKYIELKLSNYLKLWRMYRN